MEGKENMVRLYCNSNDKVMSIAESLSQLFSGGINDKNNKNVNDRRRHREEEGPGGGNTGITKYNISFFFKERLINLNDKLGDLGLGLQNTTVLCLKGGVNPPKIFNRLKQVDSPERMLTYMDEESYDAICFIPKKDIKFAGFSVY